MRAAPTSLGREFELGKIAAIADIKHVILVWFGTGATLVALVVGVLAAFGIDRTIENQVRATIDERLREQQERIDSASIAVGVVNQQVSQKVGELQKVAESTDASIKKLQKLIEDEDLAPALNRMVQEFSLINGLRLDVEFEFTKSTDELERVHSDLYNQVFPLSIEFLKIPEDFEDGGQIDRGVNPTNCDLASIQFSSARTVTSLGEHAVFNESNMFIPFERCVLQRDISHLHAFNGIRLYDRHRGIWPVEDFPIEKDRHFIEAIKITLIINEARNMTITLENVSLHHDEEEGIIHYTATDVDFGSIKENHFAKYSATSN